MKGFPKTLKTKADYYNCLAMVAAGELNAADLERKIESLEKTKVYPVRRSRNCAGEKGGNNLLLRRGGRGHGI